VDRLEGGKKERKSPQWKVYKGRGGGEEQPPKKPLKGGANAKPSPKKLPRAWKTIASPILRRERAQKKKKKRTQGPAKKALGGASPDGFESLSPKGSLEKKKT